MPIRLNLRIYFALWLLFAAAAHWWPMATTVTMMLMMTSVALVAVVLFPLVWSHCLIVGIASPMLHTMVFRCPFDLIFVELSVWLAHREIEHRLFHTWPEMR